MTKEELAEYLKDNLELYYNKEIGSFGEGGYEIIQLKLEGVVISEVCLDD